MIDSVVLALRDAASGRRLYRQLTSLWHGLSLRTLKFQHDIQDKQDAAEPANRTLRMVGLAHWDKPPFRNGRVIDEGSPWLRRSALITGGSTASSSSLTWRQPATASSSTTARATWAGS